MRIVYSGAARDEIGRAVDYLSLHGRVGMDVAFLDEAVAAERFMIEFPAASPVAFGDVRRCLLTRFPYQMVYRVEGDAIVIYAVAHQSRRPAYWRKRIPRL